MPAILLILFLILSLLQKPENPKVDRIFVDSPQNAGYIFEYANASILEDEPLQEGAIGCLISELKNTGLFTDVDIRLEENAPGGKVNVHITPTYHPRISSFVISEIIFESFEGVDENMLRWNLSRKGVSPGIYLLRNPPPKLEPLVQDAAFDIYGYDAEKIEQLEDMLFHLSFSVEVVAREIVKLTIIAGRRKLCR